MPEQTGRKIMYETNGGTKNEQRTESKWFCVHLIFPFT